MIKAHKNNTLDFANLTYAEQSKAITAQINNVTAAIKAHAKRSVKEGKKNPLESNIAALKRMTAKLEELV